MFRQSLFAALVVLPFAVQFASASTCTRTYTVQQGDICDTISAANKVSTYQLAAINPGINSECSNLEPGQVLCLGTDASEDCQTTYVVNPGDTCDIVAAATGANTTILTLNNPNIGQDCFLYIGEVLCAATTVQVPPAPAGTPPDTMNNTPSWNGDHHGKHKGHHKGNHNDSPSNTPITDNNNEDDDQLPWCDEIDN
ncbi:hypothetical protein BD410DRAFT_772857 [Rickenella mellea]|uniref:LysM domain-containing protein n=1 Tax=Rickenella mellea TaxID=50990 RepID=A0A4Y7PXX9_9AGAM|nr:hypothetical protein BD410DRAFT_772857 [Rickenella mellea]